MVALLFGGALVSGCSDSQVMDLEAASFVSGIEIEPSWAIIAPDGEQQFVAQVRDENGEAVSGSVQWSTSDPDVLEVDASGRVVGVNEGAASLTASYHGVTEKITVDVKGEVTGLKLSHASLTLDEGQRTQLQATYVYANGAERPARRARWWSNDQSVIEVDSDGLVRAVKSGTAFLAVRGRDNKAPHLNVVVRPAQVASVQVGGPSSKLRPGAQVQFWADVYDHTGNHLQKDVRWSSSNHSVASVSSDGKVRGRRPGQATITATSGSATGSFAVEVTSPAAADAERGRRPTRVDDLVVVSVTDTEATLRFTEVGDGAGGPAKYEVRFGRSPWRGGWSAGHPVTKGTCAGPLQGTGAGHPLTCTVDGLQPKTEYAFQVLASEDPSQAQGRHGPPSQRVRGRTENAPLQVEVLPSGATLEMGEELQLKAQLTDAYGDELNQEVKRSSTRSSVVTVSPAGVVRAVGPGEAEVRVTAHEIDGSSKIRVRRSLGGRPSGEPPGFLRVTERSFDRLEENGWEARETDDFTIEEDPAAPLSPSKVGLARYPKGWEGGRGPINSWRQFDTKTHLYHSFAFKVSENWEGHRSGVNKIFFVTDPDNAANPVYYNAKGVGDGPLFFRVQIQSTTVQNRPLDPNVGRADIVRGQWHTIEIYMAANDIGRANGELHVWLDGVKSHQYNDVEYWGHGDSIGWNQVKWNPTWGGVDGRTDEEMFQYVDHVYVSGK